MFRTLPGFRALYPEDCARRNFIFEKWRKTAESFGFRQFDPPVLEQVELFTEKSGEEIKSQLFEFSDKGGREVSLRPEMTPSLARMVGEKAGAIRRPVKWFAIGENYRYERQQKGRLRAFYQFNADILGEESVFADAEVIALLIESLRAFGLTSDEFKLRLGDRKLWTLFLKGAGVPEGGIVPALSAVDKLEKVSPEAFEEILCAALGGGGAQAAALAEKIRAFIGLADLGSIRAAFGGDSPASEEARERLGEWDRLLEILDAMGVGDFVKPDLGIVRGLAYYTGFVFEAFQTVGTGRALAGGGRYDNLVGKLGYQDMCAVGFGMGDVTVGDLLDLVGKGGSSERPPEAYFVIGCEEARTPALKMASRLRRAGIAAEYSFKVQAFGKQFKQADASGAKFAVVLGAEELAGGFVKVKNLRDSSEVKVGQDALEAFLKGEF